MQALLFPGTVSSRKISPLISYRRVEMSVLLMQFFQDLKLPILLQKYFHNNKNCKDHCSCSSSSPCMIDLQK